MKEFFAGNPVSRDYRHLAHRLCQPQMNKLALIYFLYTLIVSVGSAIAGVVLAGVGSALISLCTGQPLIHNGFLHFKHSLDNVFNILKASFH